MSNLTEKLRLLGVNVSKRDLPPVNMATRPVKSNLLSILNGEYKYNEFGTSFVIENYFAYGSLEKLEIPKPKEKLHSIANWCGDLGIIEHEPDKLVFIDTETSGLAGGTGTYTFLIGAGKFEEHQFNISQFFLHDPAEESAQLYALETFISGCRTVVTYNGKSFDIPLLNTRFITHGWKPIFSELGHIDLLHLARRLWHDRIPSRTLGNIETNVLGIFRTQEDVPGWMIPQIYFDFLQFGDTIQLKNVQYHNMMDVLSLSLLFNYLIDLINDPYSFVTSDEDFLSLAKFHEEIDNIQIAIALYQKCLDMPILPQKRITALDRLAAIYKRQNNLSNAIPLWEEAAQQEHLNAYLELAKYYEHHEHNIFKALQLTNQAIRILERTSNTDLNKIKWLPELEHRQNRLIRLSMQN